MTSPDALRRPRLRWRVAVGLAAVALAGVAIATPAGAAAPDPSVPVDVPSDPVPTDPPAGTSRAAETTTTTLVASATTVVVGTPVTVTATVVPAGSAVVAGGTVEFLVGTTSLGTAVVNSTGQATRNITLTAVGAQPVTAAFAGTADADPSTSSPLTITVTAATPPPPPPPPADPVDPPARAARGTGTGVGPAGQTLSVTPNEGLDPEGTEVEVSGTGFTAAAGFDIAQGGMYVALCVDKGPGVAPSPCVGGVDMEGGSGTSKWVTNNPYDGVPPESVVAVAPDGSFHATLHLVAADEFVNCLDLPAGERCIVATRMDHRSSADRSQDVKVAVCWEGQPACATEPIPPADPADPADPDNQPFSGYQLDPTGGGTGATSTSRTTGGGLAATGPELAVLPWGLALLGLGLALVLAARRLSPRPHAPISPSGGSPS